MHGAVQKREAGDASGMVPAESTRSAHTGAVTCRRLLKADICMVADDRVPGELRAFLGEVGPEVRAARFFPCQRAARNQVRHITSFEQRTRFTQSFTRSYDPAFLPQDS